MHLEHLNISSRTAGIVEISIFKVLKDYITLPVRKRMDFLVARITTPQPVMSLFYDLPFIRRRENRRTFFVWKDLVFKTQAACLSNQVLRICLTTTNKSSLFTLVVLAKIFNTSTIKELFFSFLLKVQYLLDHRQKLV